MIDELLLDIDNKFNDKYINEEIIKESEKLPNKIKISLEKGKIIDKEWNNNNKLNLFLEMNTLIILFKLLNNLV